MQTSSKYALWIILASSTLSVMAGAIIAPVLNLMGEELGVVPELARLIITTHGIFIALCSPFIGMIIDRIGVKKPFVFGLVIYGLAGGSGLLITNYWLLIVSRMILGIGVAATFTSITVIILNLYAGSERNKVMGWRASSNSIGGVIWPLLGGFLGTFSWHLPFVAYLAGVPLGLLALLSIPEAHRETTRVSGSTDSSQSALGLVKNIPILYVICGLAFLTNLLLYAIVVFMPKLVEQLGIVSPFYIGILISTSSLAAGITSLVYGRIKAKLSYKAIVVVVMALWVIGFITMSQAFYVWVVGLSITLYGIGLGMMMPTVAIWVGELVPASFRGRITSYLATFGFVGQFLSPIILNPVALFLGLNNMFLVLAGACSLFFILFLVFLRQ
ncbi:MFS transporter [Chloroflexota bacterium]